MRTEDVQETARVAGGSSILPIIVFFILAWISAQNADTTMVYDACGSSLRGVVIADMIVHVLSCIIPCIAVCITACCHHDSQCGIITTAIFAIILVVAFICLSALSLQYSVDAHNNKNCTDALSSQAGGIGSPSANTGSPLLMITGYIYGSLYCILSLVFLITACFFTCVGVHSR